MCCLASHHIYLGLLRRVCWFPAVRLGQHLCKMNPDISWRSLGPSYPHQSNLFCPQLSKAEQKWIPKKTESRTFEQSSRLFASNVGDGETYQNCAASQCVWFQGCFRDALLIVLMCFSYSLWSIFESIFGQQSLQSLEIVWMPQYSFVLYERLDWDSSPSTSLDYLLNASLPISSIRLHSRIRNL